MANFSNPNVQIPWGPAGGYAAYLQQKQSADAQPYLLEELALANKMKDAEYQRYRAMTPHELDIKNLEAGRAREMQGAIPQYREGQVGSFLEQAARGRVASETAGSSIDVINTGNVVKSLENVATRLESEMANNPMMGQAEYQRLRQSMPPQIAQSFPPTYSPEVPGQIRALSQSLMNNPGHRREMEKQGGINRSHENVGAAHDTTNLEIARINAKSREDVAELRAKMTQARENFQQYLTNWARKEVTEGRMTIEQAAKAVEQMMINSKMAGAPEDPRALPREVLGNQPINPTPQPRVPPPSAIPPGPQVPQQSRPQPGQPLSQQQVQQMGGLFDPRYDYAVGPDGKLKRKLKQ